MRSTEVKGPLANLARQAGVLTSYHDVSGEEQFASPDSLVAVMSAMGIPIMTEAETEDAIKWLKEEDERQGNPVVVAWDGVLPGAFRLSLSAAHGEAAEKRLSAAEDSGEQSLPPGYYFTEDQQTLVISAPATTFSRNQKEKRTGLFAPIYSLHSKSSWGAGDFSDAAELMRWAGRKRISVLGTLPLSAQFLDEPCDVSPYQPASRLFLNEFFLDPRRLPEFRESEQAHRLAASVEFDRHLKEVQAGETVDYRRVMSLKRQMLEILSANFFSGRTENTPSKSGTGFRVSRFQDYLKEDPEVTDYARFRAARESGLLESEEARIKYHTYVQWAAEEQLDDLVKTGRAQGVELYLDLPLGSHPQGYDVWKYGDIFATSMSAGAPPDPLGPEGQVWGFPPICPRRSRLTHHDYFRKLLRRYTSLSGMLRIDHVMGLHRLYWVPNGVPGSEGVYVKYPAEELWAIVCLESHLNECEIVGEDLGTVPDAVRAELRKRQAKGLYVLPFEVHPEAREGARLVDPPENSVASLNTHDLIPYAGWGQGLDIEERLERGSLKPDDAEGERRARREIGDSIKDELSAQGFWPEQEDDQILTATKAAHRYLAASEAEVVLVNIEDLWGETEPQNRPGTVDPVPNWRKRFQLSIEEITASSDVSSQIKEIVQIRGKRQMEMSLTTESTKSAAKIPAPKSKAQNPKSKVKVTKSTIAETAPSPAIPAGATMAVFRMTDDDKYLFNEGSHLKLYEKLGSHKGVVDGIGGCHFAVWAPNAASVHVIGDFNGWNHDNHPLFMNGSSGVWEGFIPGIDETAIYKYFIRSHRNGHQAEKSDPFAFHTETPPKTGSIVWQPKYEWTDADWMATRGDRNKLDAPISIYELHPGSWRRVVEQGERSLSYRELADQLPQYVKELGFTHVEFMPLMEHPFYGSWGYQTTGFFAPTSRFGTPQDLMFLIDALHREGIGVILDWVPSHFPTDGHGLAMFDGTHLYEHEDRRQGFHPDWGSLIFNYGRNEVRSFIFSSAFFWLEQFHADGLRVDAVASMLYLDYSRKAGEWIPNKFGGRENLEAISFLRRLNEEVYLHFPDVQMIAEESTSWPAVSRPTWLGGLGFGMKWDMGWMHDMLDYFTKDPIYRRFHHNALTFRMLYAWHENFMLPLSHDEVVHGKGSLLGRMPGDLWQKFANLRLLLTLQFTQPGKKLLFMGAELGQWAEWNHDRSLDWHLLDYPSHAGLKQLVTDLNRNYRAEKALHELDCESEGFEWVDCNDADSSTLSFLRWSRDHKECALAVFNFTPVTRFDYRVGVPFGGSWREIFNSDSEYYGGSGKGNMGEVYSIGDGFHGRPDSLMITLPPLGGVILKLKTEN